MAEPLPEKGKSAVFCLRAMAVFWLVLAGVDALVIRSMGWDSFRTYVLVHFLYAGVGCLVVASLLSRGKRLARIAIWFVLPFCLVLFPVGPALALYAAVKLESAEMKEFFKRQREASSTEAEP